MDTTDKSQDGHRHISRRYLFVVSATFTFFAIGAASGLLSILGVLHSDLFTILSVGLTVLGVILTFFQWLFRASSTETNVALYAPPIITPSIVDVPSSQSSPPPSPVIHKNIHRDIVGLPPPTIPKIIQQRQKVVEEIYALLTRPDITAIVLTGIAGAGKSTLAALVHRYVAEQRYADKKFSTTVWIRIDPTVTIADLAGTVFEALNKSLSDFDHLPPRDQAVALFNVLNGSDKPLLIVLDQFDNLLDGQTGQALEDRPGIGEWLDALNSQPCISRVLFTSRIWPQGTREYPPTYMQEYRVKGLDITEGVELLRKQGVALVQATDRELNKAVVRCDGHALALTLLASLLRRNPNLNLTTFFEDEVYAELWMGDIARNFLHYIYTKQLDNVQRQLLLAFAIYREPVPLAAAQMLIAEISKATILAALDGLLAQHLLQTSQEGHYQLHAIVATYARSHFQEVDEQATEQRLKAAHAQAAQYYMQQAAKMCPPKEERRRIADVRPLIEATWHIGQADQWKEAYNLMQEQNIFSNLKRWGRNAILLELYQLLLPLEKWKPTPTQEKTFFIELGRICRTVGQRERARQYLEQALVLCREVGDRSAEATALSFMGSVYADLGQKEEALKYLEKALNIRREIGDRNGQGWTLDTMGRIYFSLGQEESAQKYCEETLEIRKEVGDHSGEGRTLNTLGRIYNNLGQKERARKYLESALEICREVGDRSGEGLALNSLGLIYVDLGEMEQGQQYLEQALNVRQDVGDRGGEERTLNNLGRVHRLIGQKELALQYLKKALNISEEIGDLWGESKILNNLGIVSYEQKQHEEALNYLNRALHICMDVGDPIGEGWTLHNLGRVYTDLGQKERAQQYYEQALRIRREIGERRGEGWTLHNLGLLYFERKQYNVALACFLLVESIFYEVQNPDRGLPEQYINRLREELGEQEFATLSATIKPEQAYQIVDDALRGVAQV